MSAVLTTKNNKHITDLTDQQVCEVLDILHKLYPNAECALDHESVYQLLQAVAMSAQTTDKSVNLVTPALFSKYPDAASLAAAVNSRGFEAVVAEVTELIRRIGMYRTKAKAVVERAIILESEFGGEVPQDMDRLQTLPGVGRKTANVVLAVGFGEQRMPVDTHVLRVSHRIGLVLEEAASWDDALSTEKALLKIIPEDRLTEAHHSLIFHGRSLCTARNPQCSACPLQHICKHIGG